LEVIQDYGEGTRPKSKNDGQGEVEDEGDDDDDDDGDEAADDVELLRESDEIHELLDEVEEEEPEVMPSPKRSRRSNRIIVAPSRMPVLINRPNMPKHK
jgi:chromatin segregation and condensation protein Rec8/ScpA/Scc1 (kleisin family)